MGRPLKKQHYLGNVGKTNTPVIHQIQATVYGSADSGATAGYLNSQISQNRFKTTTVNGTSATKLVNSTAIVQGTCAVKVFPITPYPTTYATANVTLGAAGNGNVVLGGTGYKVGDYITYVGGTYAGAANVQVLAVNAAAGNAITSLSAPINAAGAQKYTALPANVAGIATTASTGTGTGAVVSSNFALDTTFIVTGGAGYTATSATVAYEPSLIEATVTNPTVSGGTVATGSLTITNKGSFTTFPTVTVENTSQSSPEYVRVISSHMVTTWQGNQYRWFPRGATVPTNYPSAGVKAAYLDTL